MARGERAGERGLRVTLTGRIDQCPAVQITVECDTALRCAISRPQHLVDYARACWLASRPTIIWLIETTADVRFHCE